ncbi:hypothetical protein AMTR_s00021p00213150 [Amborella trichopoda]|uniref:Uncharacterized protein n=1 Tax=Amborella trichopoda TaxID=13333 RepID=W1PZZ7_AMBTC|nr:hypothetical protein AMTR_s00021p00213150 [Amborella trichopoda]
MERYFETTVYLTDTATLSGGLNGMQMSNGGLAPSTHGMTMTLREPWAEQELQQRGVQDLASAMAITEHLVEFRRDSPSKQRAFKVDMVMVVEIKRKSPAPRVDLSSPQGCEATRKGLASPQVRKVTRTDGTSPSQET